MKKYLWLVAFVAALTLVFVGCGGGGGPGTDEPIIVDGPDSVNLVGNFRYGTGYQGLVKWSDLINQSIKAGDVYEIDLEFTVNRDLEAKLQWVLVDTSPDARPNAYWSVLSGEWKKITNGADDGIEDGIEPGGSEPSYNEGDTVTVPDYPEALKAGTTISYKGRTMALQAGPAASSNIAFQSAGSGIKGGNSGGDESAAGGSTALGTITLTFTKFTVAKLVDIDGPVVECECDGDINDCICGDDCDCDPCGLPADPDFANGTGTKLLVTVGEDTVDVGTLTTITGKNADGTDREPIELKYFDNNTGYATGSRSYGNGYSYFKVDFGAGALADFSSVKATFEGITGDVGWKGFYLWASNTEPVANYLNFSTSDDTIASVETGYNGLSPKEFTFNLAAAASAAKVAAITEPEVYFIFQIHAGDAAFKVSNIQFILPGDGPCECDGDGDACTCGIDCDCEVCVTIPPYILENFDADFDFTSVGITDTVVSLGFPTTTSPRPRWDITEDTDPAFSAFAGTPASLIIVLGDTSNFKCNYWQIAVQYLSGGGGNGWAQMSVFGGGTFPDMGSDATYDEDNNVITITLNANAISYIGGSQASDGFALMANAGGEKGIDIVAAGILYAAPPPFVPVTNITGIPGAGLTTGIQLTGTVEPSDATNQTIVWSIKTPAIGAAISASNMLTATTPGTVTVVATIANGTAVGTPYTQETTITVSAPYKAVTTITGIPSTGTVGTAITLSGTVDPSDATNQTIAWSIKSAGTTGVTALTGAGSNVIPATATAGTIVVTATITNGATATTPYTQDFTIVLSDTPPSHNPVTSITGVPTTGTVGTAITLSGTVNPTDATNKVIAWSISNAGTTGVTALTGAGSNVIPATATAGTIVVTATITNGLTATTPFTDNFSIVISNPYVAVSGITGVATGGFVGSEVTIGGAVNTDATNQTIVWSLKSAGFTGVTAVTGGKFTPTAPGTITVTATVAGGTTATTAYTDDFDIEIDFANATKVTLDADNKNIGFDGLDGDHDRQLFVDAKFLIFAFTDGLNANGFGGMQIALQGNNGTGWDLYTTGDWNSWNNDGTKLIYWVVPINKFETFDSVVAEDGNMKIILNSGFTASKIAGIWLTDVDLVPDPTDDLAIDFYQKDDDGKIDGTSIEPCFLTWSLPALVEDDE
jgi:hypothetical protein